MSRGPAGEATGRSGPDGLWNSLAHEGFRLFFPFAALYAAIWPIIWVLAFGFDLPLARNVPPSLWHAHEMLVGAFGAALIGFLTTAAPEWTDTRPMRGRKLWLLAFFWGLGRVIGCFGWEDAAALGAAADLVWMSALFLYLLKLSWTQRTDRLLAFAFWLAFLIGCVAATHGGFRVGNIAFATKAMHLAGLVYLGLLGLALGRITVPVTNLVLDPTETTSPFRPHPGRLNLAPGLVLVAIMGELAAVSPAVSGFLLIAAGCAFVDRIAEAFIGRSAFQAEILLLAGASGFAGAGLILAGCARLGAPWSDINGFHAAFLGGLGLGVYAVFCIAGRLHTGGALGQSLPVRLGAICLCLSALLRIAPDFGLDLPGPFHGLAVLLWAGAFLIWLRDFWPALRRIDRPAGVVSAAPLAQIFSARGEKVF